MKKTYIKPQSFIAEAYEQEPVLAAGSQPIWGEIKKQDMDRDDLWEDESADNKNFWGVKQYDVFEE